jgi:radical SAM protein with 4Fe4S-binding SPASM domain
MDYDRIWSLLQRFVFTRSLTPRRLANFCLVTFQHQFLKNSRVVGYPIELVIDACNICNLHCPLCPTGQGRNERPQSRLSLANFKKIIEELGDYLYRLDLHNWGEPLLNKEIYDIIQYARAHNIKVDVSTNLNHFDAAAAEKLVASGLNRLIISLSGTNQETYQQYHVGGSFQKIITGTEMLLKQKKAQNSKTPVITWRFLVMRHNEHQIADVKQMARKLKIGLELVAAHGDMGNDLFWNKDKKREGAAEWLPLNEKYGFASMKPCAFLWVQSVINCNGSVSPCCAVYPEVYDFGNIFTEGGFKRVWNNENYRTARRIIREKKIRSSEDMNNICAHCLINTK